MTHIATAQLRKLQPTDLASIDFTEDTRGHTVVDRSGNQLGRVDALFIDDADRLVRFLRVSPDWPAETDARKFIVPVDAITRIHGGTIHLDRERPNLAAAPRNDSDLSEPRNVQFLYEHYGFVPFWRATYSYPPYPFF